MVEVTKEQYERWKRFLEEKNKNSRRLKEINPNDYWNISHERLKKILYVINTLPNQRRFFKASEIAKRTGFNPIGIGRQYLTYLVEKHLISYWTVSRNSHAVYEKQFSQEELPAILDALGC